MSWVITGVYSLLVFFILILGVVFGYAPLSIVFISIFSALYLKKEMFLLLSANKEAVPRDVLRKTIDSPIQDCRSLRWRIEGCYLLRFLVIWILPHMALFFLLVYQPDPLKGIVVFAIENNKTINNLFFEWFPISDRVLLAIVNIKGDFYLQRISLACSVSLISLLLGSICHLILFQPFIRLHDIYRMNFPEKMALIRLIIIPLLLLAMLLPIYLETKTIFFLKVIGSSLVFDTAQLFAVLFITILFPVGFPVLGSYLFGAFNKLVGKH